MIKKIYTRIIKALLEPHIEIFREALHEELLYIKDPQGYNERELSKSYLAWQKEEREEKKRNNIIARLFS